MKDTMPTNQPSDFLRALRRLAAAKEGPTTADLFGLSMPTRENIAEFTSEWPRIIPERRRAIAKAMDEASDESVETDFTDLFIALIDDEDEQVRADAIDGLWENEIPSVGRKLVRLVSEDRSPLVRAAAAEGLAHFLLRAETGKAANPSVANITEALLLRHTDENEDEDVRRQALESVAYSSDERVHELIKKAYEEGEESMQSSAVFAMGRSADTDWGPIVVRELRSRNAAMRYEAAYAAGELMISEALPQLIELVDDEDRQVREAAIWALGQIGGREARRVIESVIEGDDEALHEAAQDALAELDFAQGVLPFNMFDFEAESGLKGNGNGHIDIDEPDEEDEAGDAV
jgi:HEAT repeat protein